MSTNARESVYFLSGMHAQSKGMRLQAWNRVVSGVLCLFLNDPNARQWSRQSLAGWVVCAWIACRGWCMLETEACRASVTPMKNDSVSVNELVLLVTGPGPDTEKLSRVVRNAGYRPRICHDQDALQTVLSDRTSADNYVATVLCHRSLSGHENTGTESAWRPHLLPEQLHGKRLIAVSDCMNENTVVALLQEGAHHCFDLHESPRILQVRLEAALRRHGRLLRKQLVLGDIRFDLEKRRVTRAGDLVDLSPKEFELAYYLFSNWGRVVDNEELMTSIWSLPASMDTRRIDTAACRVRKKLQLAEPHGWQLKRLRCVGYRLVNTQTEQGDVGVHPDTDKLLETV